MFLETLSGSFLRNVIITSVRVFEQHCSGRLLSEHLNVQDKGHVTDTGCQGSASASELLRYG